MWNSVGVSSILNNFGVFIRNYDVVFPKFLKFTTDDLSGFLFRHK